MNREKCHECGELKKPSAYMEYGGGITAAICEDCDIIYDVVYEWSVVTRAT